MVDHVSKARRSEIMSAVKGKDTKPEFVVRRALHKAGYRYRLHQKNLPSKPDIVLRKYKAVILVHGCFWHGHGCHLAKSLPKTRTEFWENKIFSNKQRDENALNELLSSGWRVCVIWDCALNRRGKLSEKELVKLLSKWLKSKKPYLCIEGSV